MKRVMLLLGLGLLVGCTVQESNQNPLVGSWLSNKEMSIESIDSSGLPEQKKQFYANLVGKLRLDFSSDVVITSWIDGSVADQTYSYTSVDEGYRVVVNSNGQIYVYTMEGNCMWVLLDVAGGREYFCRVEGK